MKNKIDANDRNLSEILDRKFYRLFSKRICWEEKHMKSLMKILQTLFYLQSYP